MRNNWGRAWETRSRRLRLEVTYRIFSTRINVVSRVQHSQLRRQASGYLWSKLENVLSVLYVGSGHAREPLWLCGDRPERHREVGWVSKILVMRRPSGPVPGGKGTSRPNPCRRRPRQVVLSCRPLGREAATPRGHCPYRDIRHGHSRRSATPASPALKTCNAHDFSPHGGWAEGVSV